MPRRVTRWQCETCRKRHSTYDAARDCEVGHITTRCIEEFRADMGKIMRGEAP